MIYLYHINMFSYLELKDQITIGRTGGDVVCGDDGRLSGKHVQVALSEEEGFNIITVEDLGSKNRTVVNRSEIPPLKRVKVKLNSLLEFGAQQFIITDNPKLSIQDINTILEHYKAKPIFKLDPGKYKSGENTSTTSLPLPEEDSLAFREGKIKQVKKDMATIDSLLVTELKKLEEMKEKLLQNAKTKKDELKLKLQNMESDFEQYKQQLNKLKGEVMNKKVINLKDLPVEEED